MDQLEAHITTVKQKFLESYDDVASFVPEWLEEELPDDWSKLVDGKPAAEITAQDIWSLLEPKALIPMDDGTFMFDFAIRDLDIDQVVSARFDPDGSITELSVES